MYAVNAGIGRGHVACPLYGSCLLVRVSIIGGYTVYRIQQYLLPNEVLLTRHLSAHIEYIRYSPPSTCCSALASCCST